MASAARLPGDYRVGDAVFYTGASETHPNGAQLTYGGDGEIVGPATSETHKENGVAVKFSANADVICCYLTQLGRSPPPTKLPGDYRVGDAVFYASSNEKLSNGDRVLYGEEGEIKGPAYLKHHKEGVTEGVAVKFSANAGVVSCYLTTVSRTPPATTLPGGYRVGDTIFYVGTNEKLSNGDRVLYGEEGEIIGPATSDDRVSIKFTANKGAVNCYLTTLSRRPPPTTLPGGYHVGDTVFYAAPTGKFPNGDRVVYGEEGEIVGPATSDNCVAVKFKSAIYCSPNHLSRTPPPVSVAETEANMAAREQAFRDAEERAEKAASELLASETVETDMKNARGASKKKKNGKKKNQNRQNRSAHEATRAEPTGEEASDVEAKLREAEAVAAHESAEPATAPMIPRPAIIPAATLPAPPRLPGAAASPASPPPPRRRSAIKLGEPRRIELASSTVVAASLYRVDGALSTAVAATAGADGGDDDDDDAIEWATSGDGPGRNDASHFAANSGDNDNAGEDKSEETKEAVLRDLLLEDEMTCPITLECFVDPVMTPGGITYERKAIIEHILLRGCDPLDPTRVLTEADLQPNIVVRNICARRRAGQI